MKKQSNKYHRKHKFNTHGLTTPQDYFESLERDILDKLQIETPTDRPQIRAKMRFLSPPNSKQLWWTSIAAAITLMLIWTALNPPQLQKSNYNQPMASQWSSDPLTQYAEILLNETELINELDQEDLTLIIVQDEQYNSLQEEAFSQDYYYTEFQIIN